jgi:alpha-galactosidase
MKRMKLFRTNWAISVLLLAGALLVLAQTSITGFWVLKIPTGDGNFRETFFDLKQEGSSVTGNTVGGRGNPAISEGTFQDSKLHFEVAPPQFGGRGAPPNGRGRGPTVYDGVWKGGTFAMNVTGGRGGPQTGTLEPSKPEAAQPPPRIGPPALHDVKDNGLARTPAMGWNSWNLFAGRVDDKTVREIADAIVSSGMRDAGYVYVNIDDTWEGPRDANGNITSNTKFPDMKALADYVHSKGLKIGIYSSPGPKTCAQYEGSYGHEEQDAKTWAAWGIDYLKYDWCSASRIYQDSDMQAVYQKMGDALLKSGRHIVYSLCQYGRNKVWEWGPKVGANSWRTTGDIRDAWESMERLGFGPAVPGGEQGATGLTQFDISHFEKPGHFNDPDMLEVGNGHMTADEYKTHFSMWCLLASPLLAGNDLRNMTQETKDILMNRDVVAINQDPAALPAKRIPQDATSDIVVRTMKDKSIAVGLFNRGDKAADMSVTWESLGLGGKKLTVRDLWKHEAVAAAKDKFTASVPSHGVVLIRVARK